MESSEAVGKGGSSKQPTPRALFPDDRPHVRRDSSGSADVFSESTGGEDDSTFSPDEWEQNHDTDDDEQDEDERENEGGWEDRRDASSISQGAGSSAVRPSPGHPQAARQTEMTDASPPHPSSRRSPPEASTAAPGRPPSGRPLSDATLSADAISVASSGGETSSDSSDDALEFSDAVAPPTTPHPKDSSAASSSLSSSSNSSAAARAAAQGGGASGLPSAQPNDKSRPVSLSSAPPDGSSKAKSLAPNDSSGSPPDDSSLSSSAAASSAPPLPPLPAAPSSSSSSSAAPPPPPLHRFLSFKNLPKRVFGREKVIRTVAFDTLGSDGTHTQVHVALSQREPFCPNPIKMVFVFSMGVIFASFVSLFFLSATFADLILFVSVMCAPRGRSPTNAALLVALSPFAFVYLMVENTLYGFLHATLLAAGDCYARAAPGDFLGVTGLPAAVRAVLLLARERWRFAGDLSLYLRQHRGEDPVSALLCSCWPVEASAEDRQLWWEARKKRIESGTNVSTSMCCGRSYCGNLAVVEKEGLTLSSLPAEPTSQWWLCCNVAVPDAQPEDDETDFV